MRRAVGPCILFSFSGRGRGHCRESTPLVSGMSERVCEMSVCVYARAYYQVPGRVRVRDGVRYVSEFTVVRVLLRKRGSINQ